jgi:hypothetical protein
VPWSADRCGPLFPVTPKLERSVPNVGRSWDTGVTSALRAFASSSWCWRSHRRGPAVGVPHRLDDLANGIHDQFWIGFWEQVLVLG